MLSFSSLSDFVSATRVHLEMMRISTSQVSFIRDTIIMIMYNIVYSYSYPNPYPYTLPFHRYYVEWSLSFMLLPLGPTVGNDQRPFGWRTLLPLLVHIQLGTPWYWCQGAHRMCSGRSLWWKYKPRRQFDRRYVGDGPSAEFEYNYVDYCQFGGSECHPCWCCYVHGMFACTCICIFFYHK